MLRGGEPRHGAWLESLVCHIHPYKQIAWGVSAYASPAEILNDRCFRINFIPREPPRPGMCDWNSGMHFAPSLTRIASASLS